MPSKLELCNTALSLMGDDVIADFTTTKKGRAAALAFKFARLSILRAHPWRWATKRADLAVPAGESPPMGWGRIYTLPADVVRLLSVGPDDERPRYLTEGDRLFADVSPLSIRYVYDPGETDAALGLWDDMAIEAFIAGLQWRLAYVVTNSRTMEEGKRADFERALAAAKAAHGSEVDSAVFGGPSEFLMVRY